MNTTLVPGRPHRDLGGLEREPCVEVGPGLDAGDRDGRRRPQAVEVLADRSAAVVGGEDEADDALHVADRRDGVLDEGRGVLHPQDDPVPVAQRARRWATCASVIARSGEVPPIAS